MKLSLILGIFCTFHFLHPAVAFPGLGRKLFRRRADYADANETRDSNSMAAENSLIPTPDEHNMDVDLVNPELTANSNPVSQNQIPPTILRKLRRQYGDIDPELLAKISRNPEAASQLDSLVALDTRGKLKKLTGIAFLLALLKIIF